MKSLTVCLLWIIVAATPLFAAPLPDAALITMQGPGISTTGIDAVVAAAAGGGGHIYHVMPVHNLTHELTGCLLIGSIPPQLQPIIMSKPGVTGIYRSPVNPDDFLPMGSEAVSMAGAWNCLLEEVVSEEPGPPIMNDTRDPVSRGGPETPGSFSSLSSSASQGATSAAGKSNTPSAGAPAGAPGMYQTSEYMIRKIAVGIVLPESNGNGENWSGARQTTVYNAIVSGANWWATQGGAAANLTFYYNTQYSVATQYEPITMASTNDGTWIADVMSNMGYGGATYFDQVYGYTNAIRNANATDWAFTVFCVDSLNDVDGMFSDGAIAYAYLFGPFMVMTYDNDGWGINRMNQVFAHEMGHIFGAPDEYAGVGTCNASVCGSVYGYLGSVNGNCASCNANQAACVMATNILTVAPCNYTKVSIGWRDTDGDGILDPVDTNPAVTGNLNYVTPPFWGQSQIQGQGTVQDQRCPSTTRTPVSINTVTAMYNIDGGMWVVATPTDGAFNSDYEAFTLASAAQIDGFHQVFLMGTNTVGNVMMPLPLQITIDTSPPPPPLTANILEAPYAAPPAMATVQWGMMPDPQSGLSGHRVAIGILPFDPGPAGYLRQQIVPMPQPTWLFPGLPLVHGMSCYAYVAGINNAGITGPSTVSGPLTIDMTPPMPPMFVADTGAGTDQFDRLTFTWSAGSEDISGISNYLLTVRDQVGSQILTDQPTGNVLSYTASGLILMPGSKYYGTLKSVNGARQTSLASSPPSNGIMAVSFYPSIGVLKQTAGPGMPVGLNGVYVSSSGSDNPGVIYLHQGSGIAGIRTDNTQAIARGTNVQAAGYLMAAPPYGELCISQSLVDPIPGGASKTINPVVLNGKACGGSTLGSQASVIGGVGLNTIGALVTVVGNVTYASTAPPYYYTLDDGSGVTDALGNPGVGVRCYSTAPPSTDTFAWATGMCSYELGHPVVLVR